MNEEEENLISDSIDIIIVYYVRLCTNPGKIRLYPVPAVHYLQLMLSEYNPYFFFFRQGVGQMREQGTLT